MRCPEFSEPITGKTIVRGADLIAQTLATAGVKVVFTLSGNQIMPIFDACIDAKIRLIHVRHEAAAVYMAEAYAQITGEIGVALVTAAPGFANAMAPLFTARQSESPVLLLSGDSPLGRDGDGAFQELDQVSISTALTKQSRRLVDAAQAGSDVAAAIRLALSGRQGPVHLALPFDIVESDVGQPGRPRLEDMVPDCVAADADSVKTIREVLAAAERPIILTGPMLNYSRAGGLITALQESLDVPVIAMESPRGLKDPSLGAVASVLRQADVILNLGKNIDFTLGFGGTQAVNKNSQWLLVDPDPEILQRGQRALGAQVVGTYHANARLTAQALLDDRTATCRSKWREQTASAISRRSPDPVTEDGEPMSTVAVSGAIQRYLDKSDDPILVIDGGEAGQWAQACLSARTRVINGPAGAIGGCLCYAIAAKVARPAASVVVFMGDGTAGFHFSEFETAHRYGLAFLAVIGHDARWNAEYQIQLREYGKDRLYECELDATRYDLAAAGFGCHAEHVSEVSQLDAALERAAGSGLPACVVTEIAAIAAPSVV